MKKVCFDDRAAVKNIREGNLQAFTAAYYEYHRYLFHFSIRFLKSTELAEEIVHDVFLKVWENRQGLNADLSLKGYLIKICKNHILNLLQRASREQAIMEEITRSALAGHNETEDSIVAADLEVHVDRLISQLPAQRQKIFRMYRFDHMNTDEIATELDISRGTVKDHLLKANRFLRKYLSASSHIPQDVTLLFLALLSL